MSDSVIDGVDYGPLAPLIGRWQSDTGIDVSPEPDGSERSVYYETIIIQPVGIVSNAEAQDLAALHYHQVVHRKSDDKPFHNETGYWCWDAPTGLITQSFSIPRGVTVLAGGAGDEQGVITVRAAHDDPDWVIGQAPFMRDNARTLTFEHTVRVEADRLIYAESMLLEIYGRQFEHTDENTLSRA